MASDATGSGAGDILDATGQAIHRGAEDARDTTQRLLDAEGRVMRPLDRRLREGSGKTASFIQEQPIAAALLALVTGFLIARMRG